MISLQEGLSFDDFYAVIMNGRGEAEGAQKRKCYACFWCKHKRLLRTLKICTGIVKARAEGKIRRGVRLPKLPKFKEAE